MRRRPKWPSDLERPTLKTFPPYVIRRGAERVLGADKQAGILYETALRLGSGPAPVDGWMLASALGAHGIRASYDACVAFLERLEAIAGGESPAATPELRAQSAASPAPREPRPPHEAGGDRPRRRARPRRRRRRPGAAARAEGGSAGAGDRKS